MKAPRRNRLSPACLRPVSSAQRTGEPRTASQSRSWGSQGDALAGDDRVHGAHGDLGAEELATEVGDLTSGEAKARGERGDGALEAGAEVLAGNPRPQLGAGDRAAAGAAAAGEPVLGDPDRDLGQLDDLVAADRPQHRPPGERVPALRSTQASRPES